jgi:N-acetyl-alpha-D-glucosaminyl L-malate synthase BshA
MKIGIVCYPTYGGSGVVATELGMALARKGHQVHFITYKRPARLTTFQTNVFFHEVSNAEYPLFEYDPYDAALTSKLVHVVNYEKLDLLHVHYAIPHATVAYLAKKILITQGIYVPVITTLHGTDITLVGKDQSFAPVVEFGINKSDAVTVVSENLKEETYSHFKIQKDIKVIYNFIDFDQFRKINKNHFKMAIAPNGEKILTHISNFRPVKRVEDVLKVFSKIQKKIPSKLLMIGDGPERPKLEDLCRDLGLCDEVRFLGKQDAIEELLSISDLFIIPSANESFGLSALEAMACHVPVISSNVGGLPEVNEHGITGFMSAVGDVESMADHSIALLSDEKLHNKFKEQAFAKAKEFDIKKILPQYENLYREVLVQAKQNAPVK